MKKIVLKEEHIRQLVIETLENLILGEDGNTNMEFSSANDIMRLMQKYEKYVVYDRVDINPSYNEGNLQFYLNLDNVGLENEFFIELDFDIEYHWDKSYYPARHGEYWYADFCLDNLTQSRVRIIDYTNNSESEWLKIDGSSANFFNELLFKYYDDIAEICKEKFNYD